MSLNQHGRPSKDISGFRELIYDLYLNEHHSAVNICHLLASDYQTVVSIRTLRSAIANWGMHKTVSLEDTPELRMRISTCFYLLGLEDVEMLHVLRDDGRVFWDHSQLRFLITSGYQLSKRSLQTLRLKMGLRYRVVGTPALHSATEGLHQAMILEFESKLPAHYGWEYMWLHLSIRGIPVARDRIFKIMKELDPECVEARRTRFKDGRDHTGKYIVPGPNYTWSVDGHMKFQAYGIKIYAMVDGYSRYITSIFAGLPATCGVSILKQYLDAVVGNSNMRPHFIRSARGTETSLMANAHWQLEQADQPNAEFESIYFYGGLKSNSCIESWWEELTSGQTKQWQVYRQSWKPPTRYRIPC